MRTGSRYSMLVHTRDVAEKTIADLAKQTNLLRVRVISSDGTIVHSKKHSEADYSVEQTE